MGVFVDTPDWLWRPRCRSHRRPLANRVSTDDFNESLWTHLARRDEGSGMTVPELGGGGSSVHAAAGFPASSVQAA